ncbi:MAG: DNA photolyase family protein [Actinobacteria bacterium]|nr:DNA photolyase family protein [Actinomycetota bacterium]
MSAILWLRRDLRRGDHPALLKAAESGSVTPLFVLDPTLWESGGPVRRAWLAASVLAARDAYDGALLIRRGRPEEVVPAVADEAGAVSVHVSRETTPAGVRRDERVGRVLAGAGVDLVATGTPYAVGPGVVVTGGGTPFKVFTPFSRAWRDHGWPTPATEPAGVQWNRLASDPEAEALLEEAVAASPVLLPEAGESAALDRWRDFLETGLTAYGSQRNRPDRPGTSWLSPWLKVGAVHPRTLLADLADIPGEGARRYVTELAWREFYADVLWHNPSSAWQDLRPALAGMAYDEPGEAFEAWRAGRTGFPIVDAGMRQLLATGWMHNRVRMITASFLTKDLHVWWPHGARHFLDHLLDGDIASNSHGWQWVAGTGTDASPYFRVFNPITQGIRFDPHGDYVRRWVPELAHIEGAAVHEPWLLLDGLTQGYPERIVDHAEERTEALSRLAALKA